MRAHGHAVRVYRKLVASGEIASGVIGFKSDDNYPIPAREGNAEDEESAERHGAFRIGIFAQPVYGDGWVASLNYQQTSELILCS